MLGAAGLDDAAEDWNYCVLTVFAQPTLEELQEVKEGEDSLKSLKELLDRKLLASRQKGGVCERERKGEREGGGPIQYTSNSETEPPGYSL